MLALLAWLVAGSVNDYLGAKLFAVPNVEAKALSKVSGPEKAWDSGAGKPDRALRSWTMFNLGDGEVETPEGDAKAESGDTKPDEPVSAEGALEESELPIDLMGTIVADDPELSMATLRLEGNNKLAWVGSEFMDGKAKIAKINPRHIVVIEGDKERVIKLWSPKKAASPGPRGGRRTTGPRARPSTSAAKTKTPARTSSNGRLKARSKRFKDIKKTGPYAYEIQRRELNKYIDDVGGLGSQARVIPNHVGGKTHGYKLVGVRPNSLFRAIGIRSGDVIMSVNGQSINSAAKALGLFDKLKTESAVNISIERRGQTKELSYTID